MYRKKMVIKVGTGGLRSNGHPSESVFWSIASQIAAIKREGWDALLVSSGAVDAARSLLGRLGRDAREFDDGELSSIGTSELLERWKQSFMPHGLIVATAWLTHSVWSHPNQRENFRKSGAKLSGGFTVPIVNENDLLSRSELRNMARGEGDNDYLARRVACLLKADAILFLTAAGGIFNGDPSLEHTRMYRELDGRQTFRLGAKNGGASKTGIGGPQSKINQASICYRRGMRAAIAGARDNQAIVRFSDGHELVGTTISDRTAF